MMLKKYKEFISTKPPVHPKGGDVFLYKSSKPDDMDFRFDQIMWKQKGSNYHDIRKYGGRVLKCYYHIRTAECEKGTSSDFRKCIYSLMNGDKDLSANFYLIHYLGNETVYVPHKHGNA